MKKFLTLFLLVLSIISAKAQFTFEIGGQIRQYYLHLPKSLPVEAPLVFVLHGYSGSAESIMDYSGMNHVADDSGFAVCYPQGTIDRWGNHFWNVGYSFHQDETVDDVEFLTALAQYLQSEYNLSSQYTFCSGMSNGGDMSYLLACQASDVFMLSVLWPVA